MYNSTSGINNLNQFVAAEKITKDINPIYGGIQKLHARDTDLITLCEDKCLKILANKDAVFNADGNTQLTSTNNVLGQAVPFVGEFGISKNPESFAAEKYRVYFTDKQRGAVMRLSKDGLTAISDHGMTDWFRDNLRLGSRLIGSFDSEKNEYNLTIRGDSIDKTLSFKEDVRGWVSFKSFILDGGMSLANDYYSFKDGAMWKHHQAVYDDPLNPDEATNHNTFYGSYVPSWFNVILNDVPGSIKSFNTINYEGSQSRIRIPKDENNLPVNDGEYHNLSDKEGWYVDYIKTDQQEGTVDEFIEKEGKWFNYIKGKNIVHNQNDWHVTSGWDEGSFACQGIGVLNDEPVQNFDVIGCTDSTMFNFDPVAIIDDGSCIPIIFGCIDPNAHNFAPSANTNTFCEYVGCMDDNYLEFDETANVNDQSLCLTLIVYGCTDPTMFNYNPLANVSDDSCDPILDGCTDTTNANVTNFNSSANVDDGSCEYSGCTDSNAANNMVAFGPGVSLYTIDDFGFTNLCIDSTTIFPWTAAMIYYDSIGFVDTINNSTMHGLPIPFIPPCPTIDDGSCIYTGCMDENSCNYDPTATSDNGSCTYCNDPTALNFDNGNCDDYSYCTYCNDVQAVTVGDITHNSFTISWELPPTLDISHIEKFSINIADDIGTTPPPFSGLSGSSSFAFYPNGTNPLNTNITGSGDPGDPFRLVINNSSGITWPPINPTSTYYIAIDTQCTSGSNPMYSQTQVHAVVTLPSTPPPPVIGCTDPTMYNYDPLANTACNIDGGAPGNNECCVPFILGCMDDGYCVETMPTPPLSYHLCNNNAGISYNSPTPFYGAANFEPNATQDDGTCEYQGCTDQAACNFEVFHTIDTTPSSCVYCSVTMATNWDGDNVNPHYNNIDPDCGEMDNCTFCQAPDSPIYFTNVSYTAGDPSVAFEINIDLPPNYPISEVGYFTIEWFNMTTFVPGTPPNWQSFNMPFSPGIMPQTLTATHWANGQMASPYNIIHGDTYRFRLKTSCPVHGGQSSAFATTSLGGPTNASGPDPTIDWDTSTI